MSSLQRHTRKRQRKHKTAQRLNRLPTGVRHEGEDYELEDWMLGGGAKEGDK